MKCSGVVVLLLMWFYLSLFLRLYFLPPAFLFSLVNLMIYYTWVRCPCLRLWSSFSVVLFSFVTFFPNFSYSLPPLLDTVTCSVLCKVVSGDVVWWRWFPFPCLQPISPSSPPVLPPSPLMASLPCDCGSQDRKKILYTYFTVPYNTRLLIHNVCLYSIHYYLNWVVKAT